MSCKKKRRTVTMQNMNWRTPVLSDLETLQNCAVNNDFFENNYSAVNSILYEKKFDSKICILDGWLFENFFDGRIIKDKTCKEGAPFFSSYKDRVPCFSFPHNINGNTEAVKDAVALLKNEVCGAGEKLCFVNITKDEEDILLQMYPSAKITLTPESGDYIYRTEKLALLSGNKLSRKRNHIHQFEKKYPDYSFELLTQENLSFVSQVENEWLEENSASLSDEATLDLKTEKEIIQFALATFKTFSEKCGMKGALLFVSEKPVAFCISSLLSKSVTDIHFEKCLSSYARDGGYAVINNRFSKTVQTEFINRDEDLGIEGLRKAKLSYYPERIIEKYSVEI